MLPGSVGSRLVIKAAKGRKDKKGRYSEKSLGQVFAMGEGIAGTAASTRKSVIIHDTSTDTRFQARNSKVSVGSILSLPMIYSKDELVGVLNVSHPSPHAFHRTTSASSRLLSPAALALRNARLCGGDEVNRMLKAELS
jgi:putative methionine-R-sulfoxide reductase with GAF domain